MTRNLNVRQILGGGAFILGLILLAFAWRSSGAPVDQVSNALTGQYTDRTMWYVAAGAVAAIGGAILAFTATPRRS